MGPQESVTAMVHEFRDRRNLIVAGLSSLPGVSCRAPHGAFYAALDAETDADEGAFYVWKTDELRKALGDDFSLFADAYGVGEKPNFDGRIAFSSCQLAPPSSERNTPLWC